METAGKIAGYAFLVIGYAALAGGLYFLGYHTWFWYRADVAQGTVVGWQEMASYSEKRYPSNWHVSRKSAKAVIVSFRTSAGEDVIFMSKWGSAFKVYPQGAKIAVLYDPENPQKAKIRGFISLYLGPLLLLVFGCGFWIAGQLTKFFFR